MNSRFAGQVVLITGASSGIGAELARQFAADGARVALAARDGTQRRWLEFDFLRFRNGGQPLLDQLQRQPAQVELQAARQHGHRQLLRVGGREQKFNVRWRLLERLQ